MYHSVPESLTENSKLHPHPPPNLCVYRKAPGNVKNNVYHYFAFNEFDSLMQLCLFKMSLDMNSFW